MRIHRLPIVVLVAQLTGCYLQVEDESVQVTHSLCNPSTSNCIPGGGVTPISAFNSSGSNMFTVNLGDVPLLKNSDSLGPATLHTTIALKSASFDMVTTGSNADFSGVQTIQLLSAPSGSPSGTDPCVDIAKCKIIAVYDRSIDGIPDARRIVMKSRIPNLVDVIDPTSHSITIEVKASGAAPRAPFWTANLTMDLGIKSRVNYP